MATKGDISDLKVLMFGGKPMVPQVAIGGFSRTKNTGVVNSDTSGGATRQRKKYFGNVHVAEVTFYLETAQQQDYMELFVNQNEGKRFICYLAADRPIVEPYVVQVISQYQYADINAKDSGVSMTMEIFSVRDTYLDEFLLDMYPALGSDFYPWLLGLHDIVELMPIE